jgi:ABC-type multidrug transport system ATPase subunit
VNPKVLILDDATSAIDVRIEEQIHEALSALMEDRTTIVIAHRLSTISLALRVALLEGGRIVALGTHSQLMSDEPRYAAVLAHLDEDQEARRAAQEARAVAQAARQEAMEKMRQRMGSGDSSMAGGPGLGGLGGAG